MAIEDDLEEIGEVIKAGERLAEKYKPPEPDTIDTPIGDIAFRAHFTQWRGAALRFVQLQTGANSERAQAFSRSCKASGSYGDIIAGLEELARVKQGIMDGLFERKGSGSTQ